MSELKRLKMLDLLRGMAILFMAYFHVYNLIEPTEVMLTSATESHFMANFFQFFARWVGLFICISGFAFVYVSLHKLNHKEKKTPIKQLIFTTFFYAGVLILLEIGMQSLLGAGYQGGGIYDVNEGPYHRSLILGSIETGEFQTPDLYMMFYSTGILSILAICLVSLIGFLGISQKMI